MNKAVIVIAILLVLGAGFIALMPSAEAYVSNSMPCLMLVDVDGEMDFQVVSCSEYASGNYD